MLDAQSLSMMDLLLQRVRNNKSTFGGVLVISTGDFDQLPPVNGISIFTTTSIITTFIPIVLNHFVRSAGDPSLQQCLKLITKRNKTDNDKKEICRLLAQNCKFISHFNEVEHNTLITVGKHKAEDDCIHQYIDHIRSTGTNIVIHKSVDHQSSIASSNWYPANQFTIKRITSNNRQQPEILYLYVGMFDKNVNITQ